ncbi:hypothetical protein BOTBODRAFT_31154 [Botryobasidium botryosum FD-172 SS1]|uniref:Enoyl reductase (ER) domain-containing protein n=1 Tax=Botryobasidium botryosum (strain FD-172 SS1) TaxID=930990 RepID=A0A067MKJ6_BOTB1|nr:hypothetical protein BOTBODRAFT_31154 [Botryobasidium botryosum FD-172 SS1]
MSNETMRAVLVKDGKGPSENLYIGEAEKPKVGDGQVLVKIIAFGLNRMDIIQREGEYPVPPGTTPILGVEFSGNIVEIGSGVGSWKIGDEVMGLAYGGAYAEFIVVPAGMVMPKPENLSWVEAAGVPENWLTAFQALILIAELQKGQDVLIHAGASGVGVAANQLARFYSANRVFTTVSTTEKIDFLNSMGAGAPTHPISYRTQDFVEEVKKATDGKGVDVIIDFIGPDYWEKNLKSMAKDGRMVMLGLLSGTELPATSISPIIYNRLRIQGTTLRSRSQEYQENLVGRFAKEVLHHLRSQDSPDGLKVYIHDVKSWKEVRQAHDDMAASKNAGKIILTVD